ncbi:hypothetical protein [Lysobacter sp. CA199]|uniref:hypothetical protein n=1 Tax=Lysobacter sp. CA199 TaxID=3455608 RepID=UPI003F8D0DD6
MSPTDLPAPAPASPEDASHLRVLGIFYYIFAGLNVLSVVFVAFFVTLAASTSAMAPAVAESSAGLPATDKFLVIMLPIFVLVGLFSLLVGVLQFMTARRLRDRRGSGFCQIVAGLTCLSVPFGTVVGVFTFIVLARPSVKALFNGRR